MPSRGDAATKAALLGLTDNATALGWSFAGASADNSNSARCGPMGKKLRGADELDGEDRFSASNPAIGCRCSWRTRSERSSTSTTTGARSTAHTESSPTGAPTPTPSGLPPLGQASSRSSWARPASADASRDLCAKALPRVGGVPPQPDLDLRTTQFTRARAAVTIVEDLVSRKWLAHIVSSEETSTQVKIVFADVPAAEGLLTLSTTCHPESAKSPGTTNKRGSVSSLQGKPKLRMGTFAALDQRI